MTASDVFMSFIGKDVADTIRLDAQDAAQEIADQAEAARLKAQADEQSRLDAAEAAATAFRDSEPPDDIADTGGLPVQRARPVRYCAWLAALEAELASLTEGRTAYLAAQKVPTLTKQAIEALIKEDRSGLVALIQAGGNGVSTHALRGHERKLLAEKLSRDEHAASVAVDALIEVEAKIDSKARVKKGKIVTPG